MSKALLPLLLPISQHSEESNWTSPAIRSGLTSSEEYAWASAPYRPSSRTKEKSIESLWPGVVVWVKVISSTEAQTFSAVSMAVSAAELREDGTFPI